MASLTRTDSLEEKEVQPPSRRPDAPESTDDERGPAAEKERDEASAQDDQVSDQEFFRLVLDMGDKPMGEIDDMDYKFLTDFAIINVVFTVYEQLQANTFFQFKDKPQHLKSDPDQLALEEFKTKDKFRLCQLYPVILRATIGYYANVGKSYYDATIKTRRFNQVPIGLNDKAYGVVCAAVRGLVEELRDRETLIVRGERLPAVHEREDEDSS
jgi:hypothetical protein